MDPDFLTRPNIRGHFGVAGSTHWLASGVAMRMLELGGNAFDAAVAAGFVLQVAEPHLNGPLGEVPIIFHEAANRDTQVICGQGTAPQAATIQYFHDRGIDQIPGNGLLAAAIPGSFDAWMLLLRDKGTLPLDTVLTPAIEYAEKGVPVIPRMIKAIRVIQAWFKTEWPENAAIYLPGGKVPELGSFLTNPALARTWRRTLDEAKGDNREAQIDAARQIWKTGFVADAIVDFCATQSFRDVTGQSNGGLITRDDLAGWSATFEAPATAQFQGRTICKCGPWSQGPVLLQGLKMAEALGIDRLNDDVQFYHLLAEIMKLTYADRETFYGDPNAVDVPLDVLLSDEHAAARAALVGPEANNTWRPGDIPGFGHPVDFEAACNVALDKDALAALGIGEPTVAKQDAPEAALKDIIDGDTCHINVADRWGNLVAATPSGGWMESSPVIPELGFCLGTRLQMARLDDDAPGALRPGTRPRTTLTPTIVLDEDGRGYMACGTPGGDKQDQWQLAFLLRHLALGMSPQAAIDAPGFHSLHWPDSFFPRQAFPGRLCMEGRVPKVVTDALADLGHDVLVEDDWSAGYLSASYVRADGTLGAAASPRGQQNYALGR